MIKISTNKKDSICFNFDNDEQKNFFDKAKKSDIIHNNNSIFLQKILSIKNQSLLNQTLRQSKSQIFNNINESNSESKILNLNNSSTNLTLINNKIQNTFNNILDEVNLDNSLKKITKSPKRKVFSPKIIVNKNRKLCIHKDKDKEQENNKNEGNIKEPLYLLEPFTYQDKNNKTINQTIKEKYCSNTINIDCNITPEISFSNLYTKNYVRKPVVIKFNNGFDCKTLKINKKINDISNKENKENIANNSRQLKRMKTEENIKPYGYYKKNNIETELFRSFEDLEKKSLEISRRKMKNSTISTLSSFKKENNLEKLKESLQNYRRKTKIDDKKRRNKKQKIINSQKDKNLDISDKYDNKTFKLTNNIYKNEEYDFDIKAENTYKIGRWHRQKTIQLNNMNYFENIKNKNKKNNYNLLPKVKSEELLINNNNNNTEKIKKKNIILNFIEEKKTENIYNITLDTNTIVEPFNQFNEPLNSNRDFKYKNYFIRKKYSKKHNIFEEYKSQIKTGGRNKKKKDIIKSPVILKKYSEDTKTNDSDTILTYCQSLAVLPNNQPEFHIKVNKRNNSGNKINNNKACEIFSIDKKIQNEIDNHINIINGIENLNKFFNKYNKLILKKKFILFCNYYNQLKINNNTTLLTNMSNISQLSELKYVKKVIPKEKKSRSKKYNKKILRNKSFNVEKQKILIIKRKEFGFFEKYEHCLDFINIIRNIFIKYALMKK